MVAYAALAAQGLALILALFVFRRPPSPEVGLNLSVPGWCLVGFGWLMLGVAQFAYIAAVGY